MSKSQDKGVLLIVTSTWTSEDRPLTMTMYEDNTYDITDAYGRVRVDGSHWRISPHDDHERWLWFCHNTGWGWSPFEDEGYNVPEIIDLLDCEIETRKIFG